MRAFSESYLIGQRRGRNDSLVVRVMIAVCAAPTSKDVILEKNFHRSLIAS